MSFLRYPIYKDSGIKWLGLIPEDWGVSAIKHGFNVKLGKMLQPNCKEKGEVFAPYIRAANIQWTGIDTADVKKMWFSPLETQGLVLLRDDLLVSEGGDVGRTCLWRSEIENCYFQNSVNRVRSKHENSTNFLRYWLTAIKEKGFIDML